jgi:hypothetical protein
MGLCEKCVRKVKNLTSYTGQKIRQCEKCIGKVKNLTSYTERKFRLTERICINVKTDTVQKFIQCCHTFQDLSAGSAKNFDH